MCYNVVITVESLGNKVVITTEYSCDNVVIIINL